MTTTVTGKNQVTIPAEVARALGLVRGSRIEWVVSPDGRKAEVLVCPSKRELARRLQGAGRKYLKPGDDPVGDLCREREQDDEERMKSLLGGGGE